MIKRKLDRPKTLREGTRPGAADHQEFVDHAARVERAKNCWIEGKVETSPENTAFAERAIAEIKREMDRLQIPEENRSGLLDPDHITTVKNEILKAKGSSGDRDSDGIIRICEVAPRIEQLETIIHEMLHQGSIEKFNMFFGELTRQRLGLAVHDFANADKPFQLEKLGEWLNEAVTQKLTLEILFRILMQEDFMKDFGITKQDFVEIPGIYRLAESNLVKELRVGSAYLGERLNLHALIYQMAKASGKSRQEVWTAIKQAYFGVDLPAGRIFLKAFGREGLAKLGDLDSAETFLRQLREKPEESPSSDADAEPPLADAA